MKDHIVGRLTKMEVDKVGEMVVKIPNEGFTGVTLPWRKSVSLTSMVSHHTTS